MASHGHFNWLPNWNSPKLLKTKLLNRWIPKSNAILCSRVSSMFHATIHKNIASCSTIALQATRKADTKSEPEPHRVARSPTELNCSDTRHTGITSFTTDTWTQTHFDSTATRNRHGGNTFTQANVVCILFCKCVSGRVFAFPNPTFGRQVDHADLWRSDFCMDSVPTILSSYFACRVRLCISPGNNLQTSDTDSDSHDVADNCCRRYREKHLVPVGFV